MQALMMNTQLMISSILKHAEKNFPDVEMVSVTVDNPRHRQNYKTFGKRCRQLANVLESLGAKSGDRIGTLAWNDFRHMELYYAVSGSGMVCHTINPRLFPEQVAYIINHAENKILFVDVLIMPLLEALKEHLSKIETVVVLTDRAHMPDSSLPNVLCYEELLEAQSDDYEWPEFDENTASGMCYTSGTTGNPKGVVYSHRSTVLHALAGALPDVTGASNRQTSLPVVPMFHVNAWGAPYAALMVGTKLVLPGPKMADGETLHDLITSEEVTVSSGVPTIWLALLDYLEANQKSAPSLERANVGGAACPRIIVERFREQHDCAVVQGWGMTETSPLGTIFGLKKGMEDLSTEELTDLQCLQGRGVFGIEMRIVDENNEELPWDGVAFGALKVRGPWVARGYYGLSDVPGAEDCPVDEKGWFQTGDVASITAEGFLQITDRTKDVIKSGGEWISSIEIENAAVNHTDIAEAAVIGRYHPKWTERPLLIVVLQAGKSLSKEDVLEFLKDKLHKMAMPDDIAFIDELPHTATGKINKLGLRKTFEDYQFPAE
ncbi:MAG TPA: long-chain fatty acid--CoA ligase [Gammaproteobacteria bacterium]|jgi:fatty-acyl-CoA synthase|nr:long-chain fatty acid--CoA ligase [Gammaproteobacteria bacterium]MDP6733529.1 long-chain fatty acid--CoA ligase [Gammaproteobacteria bacterium]HAJ75031.1 long-chain fatty acid--CoA ligase [Gammaproteobacteria bacterium]|tara:strand:- start:2846 stop:4492 length:1647 start_codon:yes stop_codon:yes gene_type:complete